MSHDLVVYLAVGWLFVTLVRMLAGVAQQVIAPDAAVSYAEGLKPEPSLPPDSDEIVIPLYSVRIFERQNRTNRKEE